MPKDFEKKIEDLFIDKSKILSLEQMNSLIKESFLSINRLNEQQDTFSADDFLKFAPKPPMAENLIGLKDKNVDSAAIAHFKTILNDIVGSGDTIQKKFMLLNKFLTSDPSSKSYNISQILNYITFFRILNSLMYEYSGATAGNLHEAFIAGITGGAINPSNDSIDDVFTSRGSASLKLLSHDQSVKGSINLLFKALEEKSNIIYYIGFKHYTTTKNAQGGALNYYKTMLNIDNIGTKTNIYKILQVKPEKLSKDKNERLQQLINRYEELRRLNPPPPSQFTIFKTSIKEKGEVLSVNVSREALIKFINTYSAELSGDVNTIYKNLYFLTENLNKYYYSKEAKVTSYAIKASGHAQEIKASLDKKINPQ